MEQYTQTKVVISRLLSPHLHASFLQKKYPDDIVLFQLGDFFEVLPCCMLFQSCSHVFQAYCEDAYKVATALKYYLASKSCEYSLYQS
jgi:hypothetical protein